MISAAQTRYWWFDRSDLRETFSPPQNSASTWPDRAPDESSDPETDSDSEDEDFL
jgi:hypothetical protein